MNLRVLNSEKFTFIGEIIIEIRGIDIIGYNRCEFGFNLFSIQLFPIYTLEPRMILDIVFVFGSQPLFRIFLQQIVDKALCLLRSLDFWIIKKELSV